MLRNAPELLDGTKVATATSTLVQPGFHQSYVFDLAAYDRTLTKIGLNLVAKLLGLDLIRNTAFDAAVAYARDGVGGVFKYSPENSVKFADALGSAIPETHMLALLSGPGPEQFGSRQTHQFGWCQYSLFFLHRFDRANRGLLTEPCAGGGGCIPCDRNEVEECAALAATQPTNGAKWPNEGRGWG